MLELLPEGAQFRLAACGPQARENLAFLGFEVLADVVDQLGDQALELGVVRVQPLDALHDPFGVGVLSELPIGQVVTGRQSLPGRGIKVFLLPDRMAHEFGDGMLDEFVPFRRGAAALDLLEDCFDLAVIRDDPVDEILRI